MYRTNVLCIGVLSLTMLATAGCKPTAANTKVRVKKRKKVTKEKSRKDTPPLLTRCGLLSTQSSAVFPGCAAETFSRPKYIPAGAAGPSSALGFSHTPLSKLFFPDHPTTTTYRTPGAGVPTA